MILETSGSALDNQVEFVSEMSNNIKTKRQRLNTFLDNEMRKKAIRASTSVAEGANSQSSPLGKS